MKFKWTSWGSYEHWERLKIIHNFVCLTFQMVAAAKASSASPERALLGPYKPKMYINLIENKQTLFVKEFWQIRCRNLRKALGEGSQFFWLASSDHNAVGKQIAERKSIREARYVCAWMFGGLFRFWTQCVADWAFYLLQIKRPPGSSRHWGALDISLDW